MPGASLRLPARTQLLERHVRNVVHRPDDDLQAVGQSRGAHELSAGHAGHGRLNGRGQRPTVRKCEPKLLFIARSLPVQSP